MLIIHGENNLISRKRLSEKTASYKNEIIRLDGNKICLSEVKQALESYSLLSQDKLVVIENLFSRRPGKEKEEILDYLKNNAFNNLIIWERKKIDGRTLASFRKEKIEKYDLSTVIFKFLDSFWPGNQKNSLFYFHQCLKSEPPEMIFFLFCRLISQLIIALDLGEKGLEKMAPWQKSKLIRQAKKFSLEKLISLYRNFLEIDFSIKSGASPIPLASLLDLLIASL